MSTFKKFFNDESGATAIEYGLIAAGISVVIITIVQGIGTNLTGKFTTIEEALDCYPDCKAGRAGVSRWRGLVVSTLARHSRR